MTAGGDSARVFQRRPTVIAHRGIGKGTVDGKRENTRASFEAAIEGGATWLETDVRLCGDGGFVVAHHPTAADGRFFTDITTEQARDDGWLTLEELLNWLPARIGLDLDVKSSLEDAGRPPAQTTAGRLAGVMQTERDRRPLLVTSFDPAALLTVRERAPDVPLGLIGWLYFPLRKAIPAASGLGVAAVVAHYGSFQVNSVDSAPVHRDAATYVAAAHAAGLEIAAWGPGPDDAARLIGAGVDAVIVDHAPRLVSALAELGVAYGDAG